MAPPVPANPSLTGIFGVDQLLADANDRILQGSAPSVLVGVLDAANLTISDHAARYGRRQVLSSRQ